MSIRRSSSIAAGLALAALCVAPELAAEKPDLPIHDGVGGDFSIADGIWITGPGATGNLVQGNLIGTDRLGTSAVPNGDDGISLQEAASGNTIGGVAEGASHLQASAGIPTANRQMTAAAIAIAVPRPAWADEASSPATLPAAAGVVPD